jgi:exonuclease SbcC
LREQAHRRLPTPNPSANPAGVRRAPPRPSPESEQARRPWAKLSELIGSADGKAFQTFAQGLTFGSLVYLANQQLQRLNHRYLLTNVGLELRVIDRFISETRATVKNLSGGEKFLASLALALGLAQMVGQNHQMDTLFIDEGFGSLDPQTLQIAMDALCTLPEQDKLVGLISHVEAIRDRLPARIEVQREGGGFSTIQGPGCRRLSTSNN